VPVVHNALETLRGDLRTLACAVALVASAPVLGACGSSGHANTHAAAGVGESIRLDNCADWKRATRAERRQTVAQIRKFAGGPVGSSAGIQNGPVLDDQRAYRLFDSWCKNYFARGFKLYKLYTHAAALIGH
jgi:hypothetical protein